MTLSVAFIIFLIAMSGAIFMGYSMIIALLIGLAAFSAAAIRKGFRLKQIGSMALDGARGSLIVIEVMCVIGLVTASWRVSGTITIFVYYGMKIITPTLFLIIAFLLSCLLSYALGTSFGVAGTVGVIFMTLARSGGVDPVITAGVLMSGVYFGDRSSPVSSSANMVAGILLDGNDPASTPVMTFDNGTATVNTETCEALGLKFDDVSEKIKPFCTAVKSIKTAESFSDAQ